MAKVDMQKLGKEVYERFNAHDLDGMAALAAPGCTFTDMVTGVSFEGPEGFRESARYWYTAFSDARAEITNQIVHGDFIVTELVGRGTHDGPLEIPGGGTLPPTGNQVEVSFCEIVRVKDGKVEVARLYYDALSLLGQLGAAPELYPEQPIA